MEKLANIVFQCANCGMIHPGDYKQRWGSDGLGSGQGPRPVCNAEIETPSGSSQLCNGDLVAVAQQLEMEG